MYQHRTLKSEASIVSLAKKQLFPEIFHIEKYQPRGTVMAQIKESSYESASFQFVEGAYLPQTGDLIQVTVVDENKKSRISYAEVTQRQGLCFAVHFIKNFDVLERIYRQLKDNSLSHSAFQRK